LPYKDVVLWHKKQSMFSQVWRNIRYWSVLLVHMVQGSTQSRLSEHYSANNSVGLQWCNSKLKERHLFRFGHQGCANWKVNATCWQTWMCIMEHFSSLLCFWWFGSVIIAKHVGRLWYQYVSMSGVCKIEPWMGKPNWCTNCDNFFSLPWDS
jgi:hypothetical protein